MHMEKVFLGLGSNVGDRAKALKEACAALAVLLDEFEQASFYETRPRDVVDQPLFLNTVVSGMSSLEPDDLLSHLHSIEHNLGRNREQEVAKGPRTLDIDLLLFGERIIESDRLVVPHPRMLERKFVLVPLVEIAPELPHPATGTLFQDYLERLESQGIYYFESTRYSREVSREQRKR